MSEDFPEPHELPEAQVLALGDFERGYRDPDFHREDGVAIHGGSVTIIVWADADHRDLLVTTGGGQTRGQARISPDGVITPT